MLTKVPEYQLTIDSNFIKSNDSWDSAYLTLPERKIFEELKMAVCPALIQAIANCNMIWKTILIPCVELAWGGCFMGSIILGFNKTLDPTVSYSTL